MPGTPTYPKDLDRLHTNPLFLGIRYGNLWGRDLGVDAQKPEFLSGLKLLAERGLVLDSANPNPALIRAIAGVADHLPDLRIVIDHLPTGRVPSEAAARDEYWSLLRQLAKNKNVFAKLSEVAAAHIEEAGGPFNAVAPNPVTNAEFTHALGAALHRPTSLPAPIFALKLVLGEGASVVTTGQRVLPERIVAERGFAFTYPRLDGALAALLS